MDMIADQSNLPHPDLAGAWTAIKVPAYELDDCYEIPDRDLGKWIKTDPDIHKEEATAKNSVLGGKWVPLVKMLKRWNRVASTTY